jgi:hypothetical protein
MYRALFAVAVLIAAPLASSQNIEVAAIDKTAIDKTAIDKAGSDKPAPPAPRLAIRAKCTFPDGTLVAEQLVEIQPGMSAEEKRALAEHICEPIMAEAITKCDDLANRVDKLISERRLAPPMSFREHQLEKEIKETLSAAPAYCDKPH